jgi:hypothetical protein
VFARSFFTMSIMHGATVKLPAVFGRVLAACGEPTVVSLTKIIVMIHVPVEVFRPMEPGSGTDKYTAREPFRAVVTIGGAVIRRNFVVPIRADWRSTNTYRNLR